MLVENETKKKEACSEDDLFAPTLTYPGEVSTNANPIFKEQLFNLPTSAEATAWNLAHQVEGGGGDKFTSPDHCP